MLNGERTRKNMCMLATLDDRLAPGSHFPVYEITLGSQIPGSGFPFRNLRNLCLAIVNHVLSNLGLDSALSGSSRSVGHTTNGNLSYLVETGVEAESLGGNTQELDELTHGILLPFLQTISHGGELAEPTHPIRVGADDFKISVLI